MGKVLKPTEWFDIKLRNNSNLTSDQKKLIALKSFIDYLEANEFYMSVLGEGRDTKNSSIYSKQSTDIENWLCDVKFFSGDDFADVLTVVGKERMNTANEIYENHEFSQTLELIIGKVMELSPYGDIKKQIIIDDYTSGLELMKTALSIYRVYR